MSEKCPPEYRIVFSPSTGDDEPVLQIVGTEKGTIFHFACSWERTATALAWALQERNNLRRALADQVAEIERPIAIDDATAARIALRLRERNMAQPYAMTFGPAGEDLMVGVIQEAVKDPKRKPGMYIVRDDAGKLHAQQFGYQEGRAMWLGWYINGSESVPDGDIISGPYTCEALLASAIPPSAEQA